MKIVIIDGQGGRMGRSVIEQLKKSDPDLEPVSYTHLDVYKRQEQDLCSPV